MARPKNPPDLETQSVSFRPLKRGVAKVDAIAKERGTDRSEVLKMLLGLGIRAYESGRRPPVTRGNGA